MRSARNWTQHRAERTQATLPRAERAADPIVRRARAARARGARRNAREEKKGAAGRGRTASRGSASGGRENRQRSRRLRNDRKQTELLRREWVAAGVVVETFVQRRRDAEQARREQRDGEEHGERKICLTIGSFLLAGKHRGRSFPHVRHPKPQACLGSHLPIPVGAGASNSCSPVCNPARIARRVPSLAFRPRLQLPGNENRPAHPVAQ